MPGGESVLDIKWREFQVFIRNAARQSAIPGKLDVEDILAECLVLISGVLELYPHMNSASEEFNAILRQAIKRRIIRLSDVFCTGMRNYHLEVALDELALEGTSSSMPPEFFWIPSHDAQTLTDFRDFCDAVDARLHHIDARKVWGLVGYHQDDFEALMAVPRAGRPLKPETAIARHFGWPLSYAVQHLKRVQAVVERVLQLR